MVSTRVLESYGVYCNPSKFWPNGAKHSPPGDRGPPDWSEGFLLSVLPDPLWSTISQPHVNQMKNSEHASPSFLLYFDMVFIRVPESYGVYWDPSTFSEHHEKWCEALSSRWQGTASLPRGGSSSLLSRTPCDLPYLRRMLSKWRILDIDYNHF